MSSVCEIVRIALVAANLHGVPADHLVSLALHETGARDVRGDGGRSVGPWQLNCRAWVQVPCRRRMSIKAQARFAAKLLRRYRAESATTRGSLRRWNYASKGYGRRVSAKIPRARRLIRRCSR